MKPQNCRYDFGQVPHYDRFYNNFVKTSPILQSTFKRSDYDTDYAQNLKLIKSTIHLYSSTVIPGLEKDLKEMESHIKKIWMNSQKTGLKYIESLDLKKNKFKLEAELDVSQLELQTLKDNLAKLENLKN